MLSSEPEILSFRPLPVDEFIVMATDGLWDVFSSQDSVDYVNSRLVTEGIDLEAIREGIRSRVDIGFITSKLYGLFYSYERQMLAQYYTPKYRFSFRYFGEFSFSSDTTRKPRQRYCDDIVMLSLCGREQFFCPRRLCPSRSARYQK